MFWFHVYRARALDLCYASSAVRVGVVQEVKEEYTRNAIEVAGAISARPSADTGEAMIVYQWRNRCWYYYNMVTDATIDV